MKHPWRLFVVQAVGGSSPLAHPLRKGLICGAFLTRDGGWSRVVAVLGIDFMSGRALRAARAGAPDRLTRCGDGPHPGRLLPRQTGR
jgi:hypothetical protein